MKQTCLALAAALVLVVGCMSPGRSSRQAQGGRALNSGMEKYTVAGDAVASIEFMRLQPAMFAQLSSPATDPAQTRRIMVYTAVMSLVVEDIHRTVETIKKEAEAAGGYMQAMDASSIMVKVPAGLFEQVIANVEELGEVTRKEIKGSDITEEMRDLQIRLRNAEEVRKRLVTLLERADKVEDALKVERELERLTENIELLKGKINALENQVVFSTLTVHLNSPLPQRVVQEEVPFPWVRELAGELLTGRVSDVRTGKRGRGVDFDLPESFAKYYEIDYVTRATSADGVLIKVQRHPNVEGADPTFWATLIRRSLTAKQAIAVRKVRDITIKNDVAAKIIDGTKEIGGKDYSYLVAIAQGRDYVYTYEAWGPSQEFTKARESLEKSIGSMYVRRGFRGLLR